MHFCPLIYCFLYYIMAFFHYGAFTLASLEMHFFSPFSWSEWGKGEIKISIVYKSLSRKAWLFIKVFWLFILLFFFPLFLGGEREGENKNKVVVKSHDFLSICTNYCSYHSMRSPNKGEHRISAVGSWNHPKTFGWRLFVYNSVIYI